MADDGVKDEQERDEGDEPSDSSSASATYGKDVEGLIRKYGGNPKAALRVLLDENKGYRGKIKALTEGKDVNLDPTPLPDGAVVLTPEDAKQWAAFQALGKAPKDIRAALKKGEEDASEREQLAARIAEDERGALAERAAEKLGWNPKLFRKISKLENVHVTEVDEDGEKAYKARRADEADDALIPLSEYADQHLQDYPFDVGATGAGSNGNGSSHRVPNGTPYPAQSPEGTAPRGLTDEELLARKRRMMASRGVL